MHLLEVVQHEQETGVPQGRCQGPERRRAGEFPDSQYLGNARQERIDITHRNQRYPRHTIREPALQVDSELDRETRLADAARASQVHQACVVLDVHARTGPSPSRPISGVSGDGTEPIQGRQARGKTDTGVSPERSTSTMFPLNWHDNL